MMKACKVLALMLVAPAAFGKTGAPPSAQNAEQIKILRREIQRDLDDLAEGRRRAAEQRKSLLEDIAAKKSRIRKLRSP